MHLTLRFRTLYNVPSILSRTYTSLSGSLRSNGCCPELAKVRDKILHITGTFKDWSKHFQAMDETAGLSSLLVKKQDDLPFRRMKDSYVEVYLPLGTQPQLRKSYLNVYNCVRFGAILEDLDLIGVLIAYLHTKNEEHSRNPLTIITELVEKIDLRQKTILPDSDIKFTGNVTWVGSSSMEVVMHMSQYCDGNFNLVLAATLLLIARDTENERAAYVNPLKFESKEEEDIFRKGQLNKRRRIKLKETSLLRIAPNEDERSIIHELFLHTLDPKSVKFSARILPENAKWMEDTKLKSLEMCHPKEHNIHRRIFGGFLMKKAFELSWASACIYTKSKPSEVVVDNILFHTPVEIGSLLYLSSQVCYTERNFVQVRVHSEVVNPLTLFHKTTNVFHFTFCSDKEVPMIYPKTYGESILYLEAKRHYKSSIKAICENLCFTAD